MTRCRSMRRTLPMLLLAGLIAGALPAAAQTPRIQIQPKIQMQQPRLKVQPNVRPTVKPPGIKPIIPPSVAARNIMNAIPGAKILKLKNLPGGDIVGTIRIQNQLRNIRVNGQTGAVRP